MGVPGWRNKSAACAVFWEQHFRQEAKSAMEKVNLDESIDHTALQDKCVVRGASPGSTCPDYAARLRAACMPSSQHALISCEDAIGAAAEIEQLWAALRLTAGHVETGVPRAGEASD